MFTKYSLEIEQNFWVKPTILPNCWFASQASLDRNWGESHCCVWRQGEGRFAFDRSINGSWRR